MLNCDRCGLYAKGQSSICFDGTGNYKIITGYESDYDLLQILINGKYENEEKLKGKFPWLQNVGLNFENICDDCIFDMIKLKEAKIQDNENFAFLFYTSCCDKFIDNKYGKEDTKNYFKIIKEVKFPYLSYYKIYNCTENYWDELNVKYISDDALFFDYYENCIICLDCLNRNKVLNLIPEIDYKHPVLKSLKAWRDHLKNFLDFELLDNENFYKNDCTNEYTRDDYIQKYYKYLSRMNNLAINKELSLYLMSRNLNIMREYLFISKDIFNYILEK